MMTEPIASDDEFQLYFDYLIKYYQIADGLFTFSDSDERCQYSAEELALEVV